MPGDKDDNQPIKSHYRPSHNDMIRAMSEPKPSNKDIIAKLDQVLASLEVIKKLLVEKEY